MNSSSPPQPLSPSSSFTISSGSALPPPPTAITSSGPYHRGSTSHSLVRPSSPDDSDAMMQSSYQGLRINGPQSLPTPPSIAAATADMPTASEAAAAAVGRRGSSDKDYLSATAGVAKTEATSNEVARPAVDPLPSPSHPNWLIPAGRMQVTVMGIFLNIPIKRPYVRLTVGDQVYQTSVSEFPEGRWNEGFEFRVSYHAQLFDTCQLDLYDCYVLLPDRHVGRAEIRLKQLDGVPEVFSSYYEIWDKKLSLSNSSETGRKRVLASNIGALQVRIHYRYQKLQPSPPIPSSLSLTSTATTPGVEPDPADQRAVQEFRTQLQNEREGNTSSIGFAQFEENVDGAADGKNPNGANASGGWWPGNMFGGMFEETAPEGTRGGDGDAPAQVTPVQDANVTPPSTPPGAEPSLAVAAATLASEQHMFGMTTPEDDESLKSYPLIDALGMWTATKDTNRVLRSIGRLLAAFGQGFELSNLQVLTGFTVLEKFYIELDRSRTRNLVTDLGEVDLASHFWKFSMAAYGWRGINFIGKGNGIFADAIRKHSDVLSVLEFLALPREDLLAYEFRTSAVFRPSYFIARDRATNSIVLSIRGTMSAFDTLTDLVCDYQQWKGGLVHGGMKSAAQWFFTHVAPQLIAYCNKHSTSALYIVGHSLGAATASLLTMMLLDYAPEFRRGSPDDHEFKIHCFGYAPACSVSLELSERYQDYIDSYVFADDAASKVSYGSMMDVKELIIASAEAAEGLGLGKVFLSGKPEGKRWRKALGLIAECRNRLLSDETRNPRLYVAGKVYQFWMDPTKNNQTRIVIERSTPALVCTEVIVRRSILLDHLPSNYDVCFSRARQALMLKEVDNLEWEEDQRRIANGEPPLHRSRSSWVVEEPVELTESTEETGAVGEGEGAPAAAGAWGKLLRMGMLNTTTKRRSERDLKERRSERNMKERLVAAEGPTRGESM